MNISIAIYLSCQKLDFLCDFRECLRRITCIYKNYASYVISFDITAGLCVTFVPSLLLLAITILLQYIIHSYRNML